MLRGRESTSSFSEDGKKSKVVTEALTDDQKAACALWSGFTVIAGICVMFTW
jgi:hypothetical protein